MSTAVNTPSFELYSTLIQHRNTIVPPTHLEAKLSGLDGGDITAGPSADDHKVIL
jgi:hypothetical protein